MFVFDGIGPPSMLYQVLALVLMAGNLILIAAGLVGLGAVTGGLWLGVVIATGGFLAIRRPPLVWELRVGNARVSHRDRV